jgi:hypothetical protein
VTRAHAVFGPPGGKPTIASVAEKLAVDPRFDGFGAVVGRGVLGDLLLTSALENRRHAEGQSWIDLPFEAGHLRGVPEMLVALIADQSHGPNLEPESKSGRYPVGARVQDNEFVAAFATGVRVEGEVRANLRSDRFDETAGIGLDQLLTVRLAQLCGEAPSKAVGKGEPGPIPNQRPIAAASAKPSETIFYHFSIATDAPAPSHAYLYSRCLKHRLPLALQPFCCQPLTWLSGGPPKAVSLILRSNGLGLC